MNGVSISRDGHDASDLEAGLDRKYSDMLIASMHMLSAMYDALAQALSESGYPDMRSQWALGLYQIGDEAITYNQFRSVSALGTNISYAVSRLVAGEYIYEIQPVFDRRQKLLARSDRGRAVAALVGRTIGARAQAFARNGSQHVLDVSIAAHTLNANEGLWRSTLSR